MTVAPELAYAFLGVSVFGLGVALLLMRRPIRLLRAGGRAEGVVTGNNEQVIDGGKGPARTYYFPMIDYATAKGESISFVSSSGGRKPIPPGTKFALIYDPARPHEALVRSFRSLWLFPLLMALFTLPFLAVATAGLTS